MDKTPERKKPDTPIYQETLHEHIETEPEEEAKEWLKDLDQRWTK